MKKIIIIYRYIIEIICKKSRPSTSVGLGTAGGEGTLLSLFSLYD